MVNLSNILLNSLQNSNQRRLRSIYRSSITQGRQVTTGASNGGVSQTVIQGPSTGAASGVVQRGAAGSARPSSLGSQMSVTDRRVQEIDKGIETLSVAQGALEQRRLLLAQARELAGTAEQAGANRTSIGSQVNAILQQAKEVVAGASVGGKQVFGSGQSELRVPSGVAGTFAVKMGGSRTVTNTTYTSSTGSSTPVYETRPVYEDRPIYTTVPTYTPQTATGQKEWTRLLGATNNVVGSTDEISAMATGLDGAIFAVGKVSGGETLGVSTFDGQTIAGVNGSDGFLTKYNTDGTRAWTKVMGGRGWRDKANGVTVGSDGSIFVVGTIDDAEGTQLTFNGQSTIGKRDAFVTKYNSDGSQAWTTIVGTLSGEEFGSAVKVDSSGSVYLAGRTTSTTLDGQTHTRDINTETTSLSFVTKLNANGSKAWTRLSDLEGSYHPDSFDGYESSLTLGSDGTVYLGASSDYSFRDGKSKISKYDSQGNKIGDTMISANSWESGAALRQLVTGNDGSIYAAGVTRGTIDGNTSNGYDDAFLIKYNADGTKAWTKQFGGRAGDIANQMTIGTDGKIYVSGTTSGSFGGQTNSFDPNSSSSDQRDSFVTQFDSNGTQGWTKFVGSAGREFGEGLTTGRDGAIYLGGGTNWHLDGQSHTVMTQSQVNSDLYRGSSTFLTKFSTNSPTPTGTTPTGTTQVQTGTNRVQVGTQQVLVGTTTSTTVSQPVTQTRTISSPFNEFTVNLSSTASTNSAIASIDAELRYLDTMSRGVGLGLQRANISRRYLVRN